MVIFANPDVRFVEHHKEFERDVNRIILANFSFGSTIPRVYAASMSENTVIFFF